MVFMYGRVTNESVEFLSENMLLMPSAKCPVFQKK